MRLGSLGIPPCIAMKDLRWAVDAEAPLIRRRQVFYVEGYDPQGAAGYYRLFRRELKRFVGVWGVESTLSELSIDSDDLAHWTVETAGPNWRVATRYEFLRLEGLIGTNVAEPLPRRLWRAARWIVDDLTSGTLLRIFRASWRFGLHLIYPQVMIVLWLLVAIATGVLAGRIGGTGLGLGGIASAAVGFAAGVAIFAALTPLAERMLVLRIANIWPHNRLFARGVPSGYDRPNEILAGRIVQAARAGEADEIIVVSHSSGGVTAITMMARVLELDPDVGRHGPRVVYLSVASLLPGFSLHPAAERLRSATQRLAIEPSIHWIDASARKDVMNFYLFDPVEGVGIHLGERRRNPLLYAVRLRDVLAPETYNRLRTNFFRMHYQFIMGNDRRAAYDYFMTVCGPVPAEVWSRLPGGIAAAFAEDASLIEARTDAPASAS
jgi:hypothetical protein